METIANLRNMEAAKKVKQLVSAIKTCIMCTHSFNISESRPMTTHKVDNEGNIWFLSNKNSGKNKAIAANNSVDLFFGDRKTKFLTLHGNATILYDKEKIKELWHPIQKVWFKKGINDPSISVIKVTFTSGHYWDNKHRKIVELLKKAKRFLSGRNKMDTGISGNLTK